MSPRTTQPTSSDSRLSAMPIAPPGNWTISLYITSERPDLGDAVGDGADVAGVLLDRVAGKLGDLRFDLFENGAHGKLDAGGQGGQLAGDRGFIDVIPHPHAQSGEEGRIGVRGGGEGAAIFLG